MTVLRLGDGERWSAGVPPGAIPRAPAPGPAQRLAPGAAGVTGRGQRAAKAGVIARPAARIE